ncbi:NAD(P)/FAD-dependent oxidoreductase [Streptomyces ipomoeae]|uniref:NAD(P)/FAD-dependent oxidoreductase n=1 Tax=Streptomyces ipomoeae TaxID=103232 RepID=UPI002467B5CB|nr:FAD-dependent oxidoreductase [Streptomyces ipomoeae]MDX2934754.1 FAD-dependent oxidoreductase [Streptomyces ipomoeae]
MKTLNDALDIRRRVYQAFEMAETAASAEEQQQWLTFALVGGGPTGVELAGQIREIASHTLDREFHTIDPARARLLLFEGSDQVLGAFGGPLADRAARTLRNLGVELHLGTKVTDVDAHGLAAEDQDGDTTRFEARTVLWTAGVEAPPIAAALARATGATQDRAGRIAVEPDLTIPGHPEIRVTGDVMSLNRLPGLAEVAIQTGAYAGRAVRHALEGRTKQPKPFRYWDLGSAAYICRGRAVVKAGPLHLSGLTGWLAWLFIHLAFLTRFRSRLGAVLSWSVVFASGSRRERAFTMSDADAAVGRDRGSKAPSPPS